MNSRWRVALSLLAGFALVCVLSVLMRGRDADTLLRDAIRDARHLSNSENIARLDAILRTHPGHQGTLLERESYSTSPIESLGYFARIQQGRPAELARIRIHEGNLLLELNRAREAEAAFREAVRLVPTFDEARFRLLPLLALRRNPAAVREQLQAIRDTRKLSLAEMALWITADGRLTSFSEAVGTLESFVKADPGDLDSLRALCTYLSEETQQTEALRRVRDALKTAPDNPELLALLANFLLDAGQVSEAAKVLQSLRPSS